VSPAGPSDAAAAEPEPEPRDDDPRLTALLGEQGARALRALFDPFPDAIGLLWAIRDEHGRLVDFEFGYGNPAIMRLFDLPRPQAGRYTLLEALPQMREDGSFEHYARVCDTGEPFVDEITYDTAFGEGWIRGRSSAGRRSSATACSSS
jgi:PAS domain-containing protein